MSTELQQQLWDLALSSRWFSGRSGRPVGVELGPWAGPALRPALLVVDEIGYLPVVPGGGNLFFQLVNARYEKGANELPVRHLRALCAYYGVSADYVLGLPEGLGRPR